MIKKEQIINSNYSTSMCIYTNEEILLRKEINNKLRENVMTSHKAYDKYVKNIKPTMDKLQCRFYEKYTGNRSEYKRHTEISMQYPAQARDFQNVSVDKYVSTYMNMENSNSLLYFFNMKTYYCPKCNMLKSLSGVHEKLECCGIDKVVVNLSTKSNDTAILTKVENMLIESKEKEKVNKAELVVEGNEFDIYKVIKTKNNKYKNNGYNIVKDGEIIGSSTFSLRKDNSFIIIDGKIEQMDCLDAILQLDKDIINIYKNNNADLDLKTLYSKLSKVVKAWDLVYEITPENFLALSVIYDNDLLSKISHSFALSTHVLDMDIDNKNRFKYNKLGYLYFTEELNVVIKVLNGLLQNADIEDVLIKLNNDKLIKEICLKHTKTLDDIINKKVVFQTKEMKNEFYSLLIFNYHEDVETLSFIFSKITQSHRLTSTLEMVRFILTLNMCKIVNEKIEYEYFNSPHHDYNYLNKESNLLNYFSFHVDLCAFNNINDMLKILNLPYFYKDTILRNIYFLQTEVTLLELDNKIVSKMIRNNLSSYLFLVRKNSKVYYTSLFAPEVLEELLHKHTNMLKEFQQNMVIQRLKLRTTQSAECTQLMTSKDIFNFLTYFSYSNDLSCLDSFLKKFKSGKITTKTLKTLFINGLSVRFLDDFERLKAECEALFPELVGRTINYDRLVMEHDYYMQRRREGTVDMTSVFNDRYVKFKSFHMMADKCRYIVEAPREVKDLIHEGLTQNHCMDSYGKNIESGQEMVLFVRLKRGEPLYAVSLDINGNVVQSSGKAHSAVPGEILAQLQREFANDKTKMESLEHFFNCR